MASKYANITFMGYRRENGRVGVRNHVIILPVDDISNAACEAVANNVKGTLALPHAYGRLQFVDVTAGPLDRAFGLTSVQLHTAAATSDAAIPGLAPEVAAQLRDRLAAKGEQRSAGL